MVTHHIFFVLPSTVSLLHFPLFVTAHPCQLTSIQSFSNSLSLTPASIHIYCQTLSHYSSLCSDFSYAPVHFLDSKNPCDPLISHVHLPLSGMRGYLLKLLIHSIGLSSSFSHCSAAKSISKWFKGFHQTFALRKLIGVSSATITG